MHPVTEEVTQRIVSRSKRANIAALSILIAIYVYRAVMSFVRPVPL